MSSCLPAAIQGPQGPCTTTITTSDRGDIGGGTIDRGTVPLSINKGAVDRGTVPLSINKGAVAQIYPNVWFLPGFSPLRYNMFTYYSF